MGNTTRCLPPNAGVQAPARPSPTLPVIRRLLARRSPATIRSAGLRAVGRTELQVRRPRPPRRFLAVRVAHLASGSHKPACTASGGEWLRLARLPRSVRVSTTPARDAVHLSESAAASKAVNRRTKRSASFSDIQRPSNDELVLRARARPNPLVGALRNEGREERQLTAPGVEEQRTSRTKGVPE
jgi:hypothetical protein